MKFFYICSVNYSINIPSWIDIKLLSNYKGVEIDGDKAIFKGYKKTDVQEICFASSKKDSESYQPINNTKALSDDEAQALASEYGFDLSMGKIFIFHAANTLRDRDRENFSREILKRFEETVNQGGRQFLFSHKMDSFLGMVFKAELKPMEGNEAELQLDEFVFVPNSVIIPGQPDLKVAEALEMGAAKYVSIGFRGFINFSPETDEAVWVYDSADKNHAELTEQTELSLVFLGSQRGAQKKSVLKELSIKELNINKQMEATKTIAIIGNDTGFEISAKVVNDAIEFAGLDVVEKELNESIEKINSLENEKTALESEKSELENIVKELRTPFENNILNIEKETISNEEARMTEEQIKSLPFAQLKAKSEALSANYPISKEVEEVESIEDFNLDF